MPGLYIRKRTMILTLFKKKKKYIYIYKTGLVVQCFCRFMQQGHDSDVLKLSVAYAFRTNITMEVIIRVRVTFWNALQES